MPRGVLDGATPETNRLRQALLAGVRMIMPSIIVLGNACYEGPPQYEGSGSVTCSEDQCLDARMGLEKPWCANSGL